MHLGIISILLTDTHSKFPPSNLRIGAHGCTNHTVPYGTALLGWRSPRLLVRPARQDFSPFMARWAEEATPAISKVSKMSITDSSGAFYLFERSELQ
jgi:hypothetical protein